MIEQQWVTVCQQQDLVEASGVCARLDDQQVAIFLLSQSEPKLYALSNYDPIGRANVMARGIVGDVEGEPVVASPLYKQHFSLNTGLCIEEQEYRLPVFAVRVVGDDVQLARAVA